MNKLLPSLTGGKMSSSHPAHTKIMFLDDAEEVRTKINNASCLTGVAEGNGVLPIAEHILFPISEVWAWEHETPQGASSGQTRDRHAFIAEDAPAKTLFSVTTGGPSNPETSNRHFVTYEALEQEYVSGIIQPQDLKHAVAKALNAVLEPIRSAYAHSEEWKQSDRMGYPEDWPSE
jgi:tyrosyl-tRNA synthetase